MATNASGREYKCIVGKQDINVLNIGGDGSLADDDFVSGSRLFMRLNQLNNINYDAAFTNASVMRSGRRAYEDGDFIRHYGSGVWTWDFDYLVENEVMLQTLLSLATGVADCTGAIDINSGVHDAFEDLSHGKSSGSDNVGIILLEAGTSNTGLDADDQIMHSAVLQNLTLSFSMGTDAGRMHASGQFMSGYAPIIKNSGVTGATTASNFEKSIFDFASGALTVGGHAVTCTDFTMTISNEANRVGFQGTSAETDGYVRGGLFDISGSITVKYDANMADALSADWKANTAYALALNDGSTFDISIPSARMTGHNLDFADEGMFVEIPFTATTGAAASGSLAVITMS
ncbi:MAG: hypothetical protein Tp1111DCM1112741_17 [Prokaryotic dsDNA virus sp.]|nr:MAG: hypothetical protein Tp1111DCM1112741_17 [Prokaryotic dsDNA virus sp.]|tara:strand:- start:13611 stop:14648 length:1038 start_codon:yes stop_codon:yes gene_type:complete